MISLLCLIGTIIGDIIMIIITSVWTMAHRKSKQKEAIIKVLRRTSSHPTAEWIYEQARKEMPGIGLATVYRNLRSLKEAGEISEMHIFSDAARFDGNTNMHYHFCCDRCGKILDLDEPIDATIETKIARRTGLKVTGHHLELAGLCLDCQEAENDTGNSVQR